jgi:hypothetical protein
MTILLALTFETDNPTAIEYLYKRIIEAQYEIVHNKDLKRFTVEIQTTQEAR